MEFVIDYEADVDDGEISSLREAFNKTDPKDLQRMIFRLWSVGCDDWTFFQAKRKD